MPGKVTHRAASRSPTSMPSSSALVATTASRSPSDEALLDLAPLGRRVAGPVGRDPLGQVAAPGLLEPRPREALDQLDAAARLEEADRPHLALDELGEQRGCLRQRRRRAGRAARRRAAGSTSRSGARPAGRRRGRRARARGRSAARASSSGLAIVALASTKRGSAPYARASRRRRRSTLATCEPNTPR